jgi:hypothetical protein
MTAGCPRWNIGLKAYAAQGLQAAFLAVAKLCSPRGRGFEVRAEFS